MDDLSALQPQEPPPPVYLMGEDAQRGEIPPQALEWLKSLNKRIALGIASSNEYPKDEQTTEINNMIKFLHQQMCQAVRYNRVIHSLGMYERMLSEDTAKIINSNGLLARLRVLPWKSVLYLTPTARQSLRTNMEKSMTQWVVLLMDTVQRTFVQDLAPYRPEHTMDAARFANALPMMFSDQVYNQAQDYTDLSISLVQDFVVPAVKKERAHLSQLRCCLHGLLELFREFELRCKNQPANSRRLQDAMRSWHRRLHRSNFNNILLTYLPRALERQHVELRALGMEPDGMEPSPLVVACKRAPTDISVVELIGLHSHLMRFAPDILRLFVTESTRVDASKSYQAMDPFWYGVAVDSQLVVGEKRKSTLGERHALQAPSHMGSFCEANTTLSKESPVECGSSRLDLVSIRQSSHTSETNMQGIPVVRMVFVFLELVNRQHLRRGWISAEFLRRLVIYESSKYDAALDNIVSDALQSEARKVGMVFDRKCLVEEYMQDAPVS